MGFTDTVTKAYIRDIAAHHRKHNELSSQFCSRLPNPFTGTALHIR
jgi:hypothetical protein